MKRKILIIIIILCLFVSGCKKKDNKYDDEIEKEWAEVKIDLSDELTDTRQVNSFIISVPNWEYISSDNTIIYSNDKYILALDLGFDDDYNSIVEKSIINQKFADKVNWNNKENIKTDKYNITKTIGNVIIGKKTNKAISYEFSDGFVNGYIIGIKLNDDNLNDIDSLIKAMIESININIM